MSVRTTTYDGITNAVALYDSTSGLAFGPLFDNAGDAQDFLDHLEHIGERDPRLIPAHELSELKYEWEETR